MTEEVPLGINLKTKHPYKAMVIVDSISEKKLLEQHMRSANFKVEEPQTELVTYFHQEVEESTPAPTNEKVNNKTEEDLDIDDKEIEEQIKMGKVFSAISSVDILFLEYNNFFKGYDKIHRIEKMYPKLIVILILHNVTNNTLAEIVKLKANAYLVKPISKTVIYDRLKVLLNRKDLLPKIVFGYTNAQGINLTEVQIPPLSEVLYKVMFFDTNSVAGSEELEHIVSPDKSLSSDLMRIANSAFYGRIGRVSTLKDAITLIGLKTINHIAIVKARKTFTEKLQHPIFKKYLNEMPILTGLIALDLSKPLHLKELNDQIFIHSLLYKIGMTILALNQTERYKKLLNEFQKGKTSLDEMERKEFNIDYLQLGIKVFKIWHLPESMQKTISNQEFTLDQVNDVQDLDRLLRLANYFTLKLIGHPLNTSDYQIMESILNFYSVERDIIELFDEDYYSHIKSHPFFEVI